LRSLLHYLYLVTIQRRWINDRDAAVQYYEARETAASGRHSVGAPPVDGKIPKNNKKSMLCRSKSHVPEFVKCANVSMETLLNTGGSRVRVWGHMVSAKREPITGIWGRAPSWVHGQRVRGSGGEVA